MFSGGPVTERVACIISISLGYYLMSDLKIIYKLY